MSEYVDSDPLPRLGFLRSTGGMTPLSHEAYPLSRDNSRQALARANLSAATAWRFVTLWTQGGLGTDDGRKLGQWEHGP